MREFITPDRIANQIRMRRSGFSGTFLIVEGNSDKLVYERFINNKKCELSIANNKDNAVNALNILDKDNFSGVLAIVDADFWVIEGKPPTSKNILLTDYHDLELMLMNSPALDKLIREHGSEDKIRDFEKNILNTLLKSGQIIGYLRWVSLKYNFYLKFEDLSFKKFVNEKDLSVDISKLIKALKDNSQKHSLQDEEIHKYLKEVENKNYDSRQICCGHDLICLLSIGLCKLLGSCNSSEVKPEVLERELRLAYESSYFCQTQLYTSIQKWEENNNPYKVLKAKN
jgi:Protein of unknown function (DUF4435)